jgi:ssDNA-binding replication factor A large subunit
MSEHVSSVKIADITQGMRSLTVVAKITQIGEVQTITTKFGQARVAAATLEDQTGSIRLNLWRSQIDIVKPGDTVCLHNAFVRVFNDRNELNIGRDGKIIVLGRS